MAVGRSVDSILFKVLFIFCLLLIRAFFFDLLSAQSPPEKVKFARIEVSAGLSNSNVTCILQDSKGFLWVGTDDGLNKYDGYSFTIYRRSETDTVGLLKNTINTIFEDSRGTLWVSTRGSGLYTYDRRLDRFIRNAHLSYGLETVNIMEDRRGRVWIAGTRHSHAYAARFDPLAGQWKEFKIFPTNESVCSIIPAGEDEFWIGVRRTGFFKWNSESNALIKYEPGKNDPHSIAGSDIIRVVKDERENLWIATREGLSKFDIKAGTFTNFIARPGSRNSMLVNVVRDICVDGDYLWLATENGGLSRLNTTNDQITNFLYDKMDPFSLSDNSVWCVYKDHQGRIWAGTFSKGLCVIDNLQEKFSELDVSLQNDVVNAIWQDARNRIWIGTEGGIAVWQDSDVRDYKHEPDRKGSLSSNPVLTIFEDSRHRMWFGTWEGGVNRYDEGNDRFISYQPKDNDPQSISDANVYAIAEYHETGQMLVSSYKGLNVLTDERTGKFERHFDQRHESNNYLRTLFEDSKGNLWIGSISELNLYDIKTRKRKRFFYNNDSTRFDAIVNIIHEDKHGRLWVGTNNGLHMMVNEQYTASYTVGDGLPSNIVNGILEDDQGNLWLSTTQGVSRFNPATKAVRNYNVSDGLNSNEFKPGACFKNKEGLFFFGGKGVNVFNPASIKLNPFVPPVYFTDFRIFNQSVKIGEHDSLLQAHISETSEVTLPEHFNFFSIEFAALNFSSSSKNQYAYKLEGFDKDWINIGNKRSCTFTNLDAGTYVFRVKASNNDGLWNEQGASLTIHVLPPWWKTLWFRVAAALALGALALTFYKLRLRQIYRRNKKLEMLVDERTRALQMANEELVAREEEITSQNGELVRQREELAAQNDVLVESKKQQLDLYTQNIMEKSTVISVITRELELLKNGSSAEQERIVKFNKVLHSNILTAEDWDRFKNTFSEVYPNFFAGLRYRFPEITNAELRLSALIKLKLTLKEAAGTLGISVESVKKSRYRLKKKLTLAEEDSLEEFIGKLK